MTAPLTVALITAAPIGRPSSMRVYAEMIQRVLASHDDHIRLISVDLLADAPQWPSLPVRLQRRLQQLWLLTMAHRRLAQVQADIYHLVDGSFAHVLQGLKGKPTVVTVHDLIPVLQTEGRFAVEPPGRLARWLIARNLTVLRHQQHFCVDSTCTAQDLAAHVDKPAYVKVVPLSLRASLLSHRPKTIQSWLKRQVQGIRTLLHVGNNGFYKNRAAVVAVFARLAEYYPLRLVMAGDPLDDVLQQRLTALNLIDRVEVIPHPDDVTLAELYEQASVLLFPSYYEGFGWPPLEAMAFGCPVVCSNAGSLPEVVGNAALMAAPDDVEGLAAQCRLLLDKPDQAMQLVELGQRNLDRFSERQMAVGLVEVYRAAIAQESVATSPLPIALNNV